MNENIEAENIKMNGILEIILQDFTEKSISKIT